MTNWAAVALDFNRGTRDGVHSPCCLTFYRPCPACGGGVGERLIDTHNSTVIKSCLDCGHLIDIYQNR
jgi:hypothetical protein